MLGTITKEMLKNAAIATGKQVGKMAGAIAIGAVVHGGAIIGGELLANGFRKATKKDEVEVVEVVEVV